MSDYVWVIEILATKLYREEINPFDKVFTELEDAFEACQFKHDSMVRRISEEEKEVNNINKDLIFKHISPALWLGIGDIANFNIRKFYLEPDRKNKDPYA